MPGALIHLRSGEYYASPREIGTVPFDPPAKLSPVTVIAVTGSKITGAWLERVINSFEERDDVFSKDFLATIIFAHSNPEHASTKQKLHGVFKGLKKVISTMPVLEGAFEALKLISTYYTLEYASTKPVLDDSAFKVLKKLGVLQYNFCGSQKWPQGPYFVKGSTLYEAWKLYPDTSEAFYLTTVPVPWDSSLYTSLNVTAFAPVNSVAVPSRLYFDRTPEKPLNGLRVAIKDIYDLNGVKTAGSSRSYNRIYPARAQSAPAVQLLVDKGAIIVGKTKTTTFADREIPTGDWIDTHAPFNPRGDGYVVPGGSSAGSGAALASYDWLDIAIGTDTSGSIRWPAAHSGLYGIKPTYGAAPMDGIIPSSLQFDVPAYLSRDIQSANIFGREWFGHGRFPEPNHSKKQLPSKLLYPLDYIDPSRERAMTTNPQVLKVFEDFVSKLEKYMGVKRTPIDFSELWKVKNPHGTGESFDEYFLKTYERILNYDSWHNNRQFVEDYRSAFGNDPYLPPSIMNRWKFGENISKDDRDAAVAQIGVYKKWFEENVLREDSDTLSSALLVLPWTAGFANYRDIPRPIPNDAFGHGFWSSYITSFTTGPELVFPIGTWTYESKVTHREERLPVSAGIVGAPGADFALLSFVQDFLHASGIPDHVETGPEVFRRIQDADHPPKHNL